MLSIKIAVLLLVLVVFLLLGFFFLRKHIRPYRPATWAITEGFWYLVSFGALCMGLIELERMEKLNEFLQKEKAISEEYFVKRNLLHAQTWLLKLDKDLKPEEQDGVLWFHKMRSFFDEGVNSQRWESFLSFSRNYIEGNKIADLKSYSLEYGWPSGRPVSGDKIYLQSEISWMVDSLSNFNERRLAVQKLRPAENTNYHLRYYLIFFFLLALALKFLKIYADYQRNVNPSSNGR